MLGPLHNIKRETVTLKDKVRMLSLSATLFIATLAFRNVSCAFVLQDFSGSRLRVTCLVSKHIFDLGVPEVLVGFVVTSGYLAI